MTFDSIIKILDNFGIKLASSIVEMPSISDGVFIPIHVARLSDGSTKPKKIDLIQAQDRIREVGYIPEFLLINESSEDAEHFLRSSLLVSFPDIVRNSFLSVTASKSNVWIDQKRSVLPEEKQRIASHVDQFVMLFRLPSASVLSLDEISLPTKFELLAIIRTMAPIDCETLMDALIKRGLAVPSLDWINRQFDALRKSGFVVRRGDRRYVLTLDALRRLGTAKGRQSPDVVRLLALARSRV